MATKFSNNQLRGLSSLFSRRVFSGILRNNVSLLSQILNNNFRDQYCQHTLSQVFQRAYYCLSQNYRCEYLYKNELLNQKLLSDYGTDKTIAFNEFKVGSSIADLAMFNGESKAFEIKSDLDSPYRISGQMFDYTRLFQKCYLVVPEERLNEYLNEVGNGIGIIVLTPVKRHLELEEYREAEPNQYIDSDLAISCLHTKEYMHLIESYYGSLPNVSMFGIYNECKKMMRQIPPIKLQSLFLKEIESRKSVTTSLHLVQKELRQMCFSMNMNIKDINSLNSVLATTLY